MDDIKKIDLTTRSKHFLALLVFNHEELMLMRREPNFEDYLRTFYIFTDDQLKVLKQILKDEGL